MEWAVEFTHDFNEWWGSLSEEEQGRVDASVRALSSGVKGSRHGHMRELRVQAQGRPLRVLYAFNPKRNAILLVGEDKTGDNRWYEVHVPIADRLYDEHLEELKREAEGDG